MVHEDVADGGVAGQASGRFGGDGAGFEVDQVVAGEVCWADGEGDVGAFAAQSGPVGGIEVAAADLRQGVGPTLLGRTPVVGVHGGGFGEGTDGGEHDLAGFGVQVAVEADPAPPGG